MIPKGWTAAFAALAFGAAAPASAAPVVYQFLMGEANISVTAGTTTLVENATLTLDGIFATFDDVAPALTDFHFTTAPGQSITLATAFGGYDDIVVESASMLPGAGYANLFAAQIGPNTYQVAVAPIVVNGVYSAANSAGPPPPPVSNVPIDFVNTSPLVANIDLVEQTFILEGITLAMIWVPGEADPAVLKADLTFKGMRFVPEPATASLLVLTAVGLAVLRARGRARS
jgi:hypothetical protein